MTENQFRRIALKMADVIEGEHMGHPDFRANGRIFATLAGDGQRGMVKLTPEQQMRVMLAKPGIFEPAAGAWGRGGSTMVTLAAADQETIGEAMTLAWQGTVKVKTDTLKQDWKRKKRLSGAMRAHHPSGSSKHRRLPPSVSRFRRCSRRRTAHEHSPSPSSPAVRVGLAMGWIAFACPLTMVVRRALA